MNKIELLIEKYLVVENTNGEKLKAEYLAWVKKKGHLVATSSSVFGDFVKEKKLAKNDFVDLVNAYWSVAGDRREIMQKYDYFWKHGG